MAIKIENSEKAKSINWEFLSLIRFLLAFIVVVEHLEIYADVTYLKWYKHLGAFEAILGFLLISGFSIGKSISRNKENYFKRRMQRIYPVYLASIIFQIIITGIEPNFFSIAILLINLVFLNQVFTASSFVGPSWTLAAEVWLYSLAPVFLKMDKKKLLYLIGFSFVCYAFYTCGRSLFNWPYYSGLAYGLNLFMLAFIWIAGFRLAVFPDAKKQNAIIIGLLFLGHLGITIGIQTVFRIKNHHADLILEDLPGFIGKIICCIVVYFAVVYNHQMPVFKKQYHKITTLLGNISYPLYLTHVTTLMLLQKLHVVSTTLYILASILMSFIIYYIFDFYSKKRV